MSIPSYSMRAKIELLEWTNPSDEQLDRIGNLPLPVTISDRRSIVGKTFVADLCKPLLAVASLVEFTAQLVLFTLGSLFAAIALPFNRDLSSRVFTYSWNRLDAYSAIVNLAMLLIPPLVLTGIALFSPNTHASDTRANMYLYTTHYQWPESQDRQNPQAAVSLASIPNSSPRDPNASKELLKAIYALAPNLKNSDWFSPTQKNDPKVLAAILERINTLDEHEFFSRFECTITQAPIVDPVLDSSNGITLYERSAIVEWREKHSDSPITRLDFRWTEVPTLKNAIEYYLIHGNQILQPTKDLIQKAHHTYFSS